MKKGLLIVLSGPSGAGKGTLLAEVKKKGLDFVLSISVTTRQPRNMEVDGVNYFFYTLEQVKNMTEQELRGYDTSIQFIKDFEDKKIYPLEIFNNTKYIR